MTSLQGTAKSNQQALLVWRDLQRLDVEPSARLNVLDLRCGCQEGMRLDQRALQPARHDGLDYPVFFDSETGQFFTPLLFIAVVIA